MERIKKTKVLHLNLPVDKRILFASDIHGDIKLFKSALAKVNFSNDDYLFVIGDMIEKGDFQDNLKMLKYIIELSKQKNVFFMAGNCDEIFRFILPPLDEKKFLYYALERQKSIINDIAAEMNYELKKDMDIPEFVNQIIKRYPEFYEFVDSLADVIFLNEEICLVHGGIDDLDNIPNNAIDVLKYDRFLEQTTPKSKLMIVGHYPTRNYRHDIPSADPLFDMRKNILAIDGGNNVVKGGQLNVVILESLASMNFDFVAVDHYPKYKVLLDINYDKPQKHFSFVYGKNEVEIRAKDLDFYLVKPIGSNNLIWVNKDSVFKRDNKFYCYDGSNTFLNLKKGDEISVIKVAQPFSLVKHNGITGLIETKYIDEKELFDL